MNMIRLKDSKNERLDPNITPPYYPPQLKQIEIEREILEALIKDNDLLPINFLEKGIKVAKTVAFIMLPDGGATGFLISKDILLTNHHVFKDGKITKTARILFNYQVDINGANTPVDEYVCDPDQFFYTNENLDFTIVKLKKSLNDESIDANITNFENNSNPGEQWGFIPLIGRPEIIIGKRVNIIQHPEMRRKEIACHDNIIEKFDGNYIFYTTDTMPGSSGSPVFNDKWELVALHRSTGEIQNEKWLNNKGVIVSYIINDLIATLKNDERGKKILFELGIAGLESCTATGSIAIDNGRVGGSGSITCSF